MSFGESRGLNLFITGTDTNVGKTYVAARLIEAERRRGIDCVGMKPICCGERTDAETLRAASGNALDLNDVNPVWLRIPAAPHVAAMIENRMIDLALVREAFRRMRATHPSIIVEGVGGWLVPIARNYFVADLAAELGLPIAVVVPNRLGAINHALLTVRAIRERGLPLAGIIFNHPGGTVEADSAAATTNNRAILESLLAAPILFEIKYAESGFT